MSDRTALIEGRIDRDVAGAMVPAPHGSMNLVPKDMAQAFEFAKLMAVSGECVRPVFRNNAGACLALAMQAWRDGGDPFAYANHAYIVNNQIAYEAKLVQAIVTTRAPLASRLRSTFTGEGTNRRCKVVGMLRGEPDPFEYESPAIKDIKVQNSPLWKNDPDQQLHYFAVRSWARRHVPEILVGIYSTDEIGETIDVTPIAVQEADHAPAAVAEVEMIPWEVVDHTGEVHSFEFAERAIEACRRMLIAAAADSAMLATAWENNAGFLAALGEDGMTTERDGLQRLHAELAPREARPEPAPLSPREGEGYNQPPPINIEQPSSQRRDATERPDADGVASTTASDLSASGRPDLEGEPAPATDQPADASPPAQTAEKHDPFWDQRSLRLDPPPVRGGGSLRTLDWKVWPAMILPRVRQAWATPLLNQLWQDNADSLDKFGAAQGEREKDAVVAAFDDARERLSRTPAQRAAE